MIIAASSCDTRREHRVQLGERGFVAGNIHHALRHQSAAERLVHRLFRVGDRHRAEGVAVIAVGEAEETVFPGSPTFRQYCSAILSATSTATDPESEKKTRVSPGGAIAVSRPARTQRRLVHQAAEHHVRHRLQLPRHALENMRVIVAVADAPPRRDAVDQLAAVGQDDAAAVRPHDGQGRRGDLHLAVGEPDVRKAVFIPVVVHESCRIRSVVGSRVSVIDQVAKSRQRRSGAPFLFVAARSLGRAYSGTSAPANWRRLSTVSTSPTLCSDSETTIASHAMPRPRSSGERRQRVADRAQVAAGDQDDRMAQPGHQIEVRVCVVDRAPSRRPPPR